MPEATRVRPIEYHSPRGLILGICFVWGIGVGFSINFFRGTDTVGQQDPVKNEQTTTAVRTMPTELERRRQDIPNVADVDPTPSLASATRSTIEDVVVEPPSAILTTEGGLTGRTAAPLNVTRRAPAATGQGAGSPLVAPPPIPDLSP